MCPIPTCDICRSLDHLTVHFQIGKPFAPSSNEQVAYVNNFQRKPNHDLYANTYNIVWKHHPKLSYRNEHLPFPQANTRPIFPEFHRTSFPLQSSQKSNLEALTEGMLLTQRKQDEYIKQLDFKDDVFTTHNKKVESQIVQQAISSTTTPVRLSSKLEPNPRGQYNAIVLRSVSMIYDAFYALIYLVVGSFNNIIFPFLIYFVYFYR